LHDSEGNLFQILLSLSVLSSSIYIPRLSGTSPWLLTVVMCLYGIMQYLGKPEQVHHM
jgi:hypothetical protein